MSLQPPALPQVQTYGTLVLRVAWRLAVSLRLEIKFIGVFSTVEMAENVIKRLEPKAGFCDHPEGFEISEQILDLVGWQEGFDKW
jgi:hypothetical protein